MRSLFTDLSVASISQGGRVVDIYNYDLHNVCFLLVFRRKSYITSKEAFVLVHFMFTTFLQLETVIRGRGSYEQLSLCSSSTNYAITFIKVCGH